MSKHLYTKVLATGRNAQNWTMRVREIPGYGMFVETYSIEKSRWMNVKRIQNISQAGQFMIIEKTF